MRPQRAKVFSKSRCSQNEEKTKTQTVVFAEGLGGYVHIGLGDLVKLTNLPKSS